MVSESYEIDDLEPWRPCGALHQLATQIDQRRTDYRPSYSAGSLSAPPFVSSHSSELHHHRSYIEIPQNEHPDLPSELLVTLPDFPLTLPTRYVFSKNEISCPVLPFTDAVSFERFSQADTGSLSHLKPSIWNGPWIQNGLRIPCNIINTIHSNQSASIPTDIYASEGDESSGFVTSHKVNQEPASCSTDLRRSGDSIFLNVRKLCCPQEKCTATFVRPTELK